MKKTVQTAVCFVLFLALLLAGAKAESRLYAAKGENGLYGYTDAYGFDGNLAEVRLYGDKDSDEYTVAYIDPKGNVICSWNEIWME